jgi:hypothetical protein
MLGANSTIKSPAAPGAQPEWIQTRNEAYQRQRDISTLVDEYRKTINSRFILTRPISKNVKKRAIRK